MKRYMTLLVAMCVTAMAMSPAAYAELKVAVLDTQRAIVESEGGKAFLAKVNAELKKDQDDAKRIQDELKALQEKLQKDAAVMSDEDKRLASKQLEDKQIDLQFIVNKLQKAVQDRREELMRDMVPRVDAALKDLIELEGYDLIAERQSFHYVNNKHDITRKVTEKLNLKATAR
jgi:outer membrane protein